MADRAVLPHSIEAEQSVLGSMTIDRSALGRGLELLTPSDFYRPVHQQIFLALSALAERNEPPDLIILQEELRKRGKLEDCGGTEYLMTNINTVPTAANVEHYARIVKQKSDLRKQLKVGSDLLKRARADGADPESNATWLREQFSGNGDGLAEANPFIGKFWTPSEFHARPVNNDWFCRPLIRRGDFVVTYGAPMCGKSAIAVDGATAGALAQPWAGGRYTFDAPVNTLFALGERARGFDRRIVAAMNHWGATWAQIDERIRIIPLVPNLFDSLSTTRFIDAVQELDFRPDIVIVDTYSSATLGAKEIDNDDTAVIADNVRRIMDALNCALDAIHHANRSAGEIRGASALKAAADLVLKVTAEGQLRRFEIEAANDLPPQKPITFELWPAPVNDDPDDNSVYVVWGEETEVGGLRLDDRIVEFLARQQGENFTAGEIGDAIGAEQRTVIGRLWELSKRGQVEHRLRSPLKPKSNANPYEWWAVAIPTLEALI